MASNLMQDQLAHDPGFQMHVRASMDDTCQSVAAEALDEVQSWSITGNPTGGNYTATTLPGNVNLTINGNTHTTTTIDGLGSTVGLFVGMNVAGSGVPAGATIATITGLTSITISSATTSTVSGTPITFSGGPTATIPWNATAGDLQDILQALTPVGFGNVTCSGGPFPGSTIAVTWTNNLGHQPQRLATLSSNNLTGGVSPAPAFARTTAGVFVPYHSQRANFAGRYLANPDAFVLQVSEACAGNATIQTDYNNAGPPFVLAVTETQFKSDLDFTCSSLFNDFALAP